MKKILVVNVNWLGDVIFSAPVFRALKQRFPAAQVICLAVPRVQEILACCPDLDQTMVYDERGRHRGPAGHWALIRALRRQRFDAAFLLHRSWTRAAVVFLAGIPVRVGYDTKGRGGLLTQRIAEPAAPLHRSDHYLRVIESFGIPVLDRACRLTVPQTARAEMAARLEEEGIDAAQPMVVVNTGGNWGLKRWPPGHFAVLVRRLTRELGARVVIPGAPKDVALAREIAAASQVSPLVLAGQTSLAQMLALLQRARMMITADSGPMHMASAVGCRGVAIFGPTRPELTGPRGPGEFVILQRDVGCNREACYFLRCPENVCMQGVTVDEVMETACRLWTETKGTGHVDQG